MIFLIKMIKIVTFDKHIFDWVDVQQGKISMILRKIELASGLTTFSSGYTQTALSVWRIQKYCWNKNRSHKSFINLVMISKVHFIMTLLSYLLQSVHTCTSDPELVFILDRKCDLCRYKPPNKPIFIQLSYL